MRKYLTTKNLLIGGGIIAVSVIAIILLKKKDKRNIGFTFPTQDQGGGSSSQTESSSQSESSSQTEESTPEVYDTTADRKILYNAMKGAGTDESAINKLIQRTTKEQRRKIAQDWDANTSQYGGDTLREWIEDDYSWWTGESRIINAFY